jgi:hypothetical protein
MARGQIVKGTKCYNGVMIRSIYEKLRYALLYVSAWIVVSNERQRSFFNDAGGGGTDGGFGGDCGGGGDGGACGGH